MIATLKNKKYPIICIAVFLVVLIGITLFIPIHSANFSEFFGFPKNENAVMDCTGYDFTKQTSQTDLSGDWEFFYNKWIVTDDVQDEPDTLLHFPARWTGQKVNGSRLPKTGYASYRMTMKNVGPHQRISVHVPKTEIAYRVFCNDTLMTVYGDTSKEIDASRVNGQINRVYYFESDTAADLVIVFEIAANSVGGINDAPRVTFQNVAAKEGTQIANFKYRFINDSPLIILGVLIALFLFNIVITLAMGPSKSSLSFMVLIVSVFIHYFFTRDMLFRTAVSFGAIAPPILHIFNSLTYTSLFVACFFLVRSFNKKKIFDIVNLGTFVLGGILNIIFIGSPLQYIPFAITYIAIVATTVHMLWSINKDSKALALFGLCLTALACLYVMETLDFIGKLSYGSDGVAAFVLFVVMVFINIYYLQLLRKNNKKALSAVKLERELSDMRYNTLRAQIKPHFIFNSLTSIQNMYHKSIDSGDEALKHFANHLRTNVDSEAEGLIAFEDELVNVNHYFYLENLRRENKLNMMYDIEYTDFEVPVLSLQPLVENAIKYAETEEKPDGYIKISSRLIDGNVELCVLDNGIGFDTTAITEKSKGLKNVRERFKYLLNAEMEIMTEVSLGTTITIKIPQKEAENGNHSH